VPHQRHPRYARDRADLPRPRCRGTRQNGISRLTKPIRQSALWDCLTGECAEAGPLAPEDCLACAVPNSPEPGTTRVLLVEDSPVNMEVGIAILESMGCIVETAENGLRALDRHASGEYSLIFMDRQMPEMDGFDATAEIRRREAAAGRRTPIVALTPSVVEDSRERCLAVGMDDYLAKPFTLEQMRAMLDTWLTLPKQPSPPRLAVLAASPPTTDRIDDRVLASLRQFQRDGRPDIVQEGSPIILQRRGGTSEGSGTRRRGRRPRPCSTAPATL
jgi:two-component system, sensor histidine kinase and response regulator